MAFNDDDIGGMEIGYLQTQDPAKKSADCTSRPAGNEFVSLQMGVYVKDTEDEKTELKLYTLTREKLKKSIRTTVFTIESSSDNDDFVAYKSSSVASRAPVNHDMWSMMPVRRMGCSAGISKAVDPTLECHDDRAYDEDTKQKAMKELAHLFNDATEPTVFKFKASPVTGYFRQCEENLF